MNLAEFKKSGKSLTIFDGEKIVFSSEKDALEPLIEFIKLNSSFENLIIFDKYIGRAAAMLMTLLKPKKVYTPVISQFGKEVFEKHKISCEAEKEVEYLMGIASDSMCQWEKLSVGKSPQEFLEIVIRNY